MIRFLILTFLYVHFNCVLCDKYQEEFLNALTGSKLNLRRAKSILVKEDLGSLINENFAGKPIIHHLFNIYLRNTNRSIRNELLELIVLSVQKGATVESMALGEPDSVSKGLLIRQIEVTKALVDFSKHLKVDPSKLSELYSLPCNPTPYTKLLLHADTIMKENKMAKFRGYDGLKLLLESASGEGMAPTVTPKELSLFSLTFQNLLERISTLGNDKGSGSIVYDEVSRYEIMHSVAEAASLVHQAFLNHRSVDMIAFSKALAGPLKSGRNALHTLAMSDATAMVDQLIVYFNGSIAHASSDESVNGAFEVLHNALIKKDDRGKSPIEYVALRYGPNSTTFNSFRDLCTIVLSKLQGGSADDINKMLNSCLSIILGINFDHMHPIQPVATECPGNIYNDGGWDEDTLKTEIAGDVCRCDIKEVYGKLPSSEDFFRDYVSTGTPVIFRNALIHNASSGSEMREEKFGIRKAFAREEFVQKYGSDQVIVGSIPYSESFGLKSHARLLRDVASDKAPLAILGNANGSMKAIKDVCVFGQENCDEELKINPPDYVFTVSSRSLQKKLEEDISVPPCLNFEIDGMAVLQKEGNVAMQFYLGPPGTGAPTHYHGHAANSLAYGMKKWFLFTPQDSFYSKTAALEFVQRDERTNKAFQCTQMAGDVVYVPPLWGHLTLNVQQSIGVAHEFSVESFCME